MPRTTFPVDVPYRLSGAGAALSTVQVNAVGENPAQALAIGQTIATHWLRVNGAAAAIVPERITVGAPREQSGGPHLYLIGTMNIVDSVWFPTRIDSLPGERLGEALAGLDEKAMHAVLFDCSDLAFINTVGLTGLAAHVKRLRIHLINVSTSVQKVLDIVGLGRYVSTFPNLEAALSAIPVR